MRSLVLATVLVVSACDLSSIDRSGPGFSKVPTPTDSWGNITFGPGGEVYLQASDGLLRFDGSQFVFVEPALPAEVAGKAVHVERDGTMYCGDYRLRPHAAAWETYELPDAEDRRLVGASDGSLYVSGSVAAGQQLFHQPKGGGSWTPVGPTTAAPDGLYADGLAAVWFETVHDELYVARGDTLKYVGSSRGLTGVGADGTLYYFEGISLPDWGGYGMIVARTEAGDERLVTRGTCKDAVMVCPTSDFLGAAGLLTQVQLAGDGAFYELWSDPPPLDYRVAVLKLSPGDASWHPVADPYDVYAAGSGSLGLYATSKGDLWATTVRQVGSIGPDSYYNALYGAVFRVNR